MELPKITAHAELAALSTTDHDALVAVYTDLDTLSSLQFSWTSAIEPYRSIDKDFGQAVVLVPSSAVGGNRLILAPTGSLNDDTDDVRKIGEAAKAGVTRAIEAGAKRPAVVLAQAPPSPAEAPLDADYSRWIEVALLGALEASYVTLVVREFRESSRKGELENLSSIDLVVPGVTTQESLEHVVTRVRAIEAGRRLAKDIGYGDPERMTPYKCAEYVEQAVKGIKGIEYEEIKDLEVLKKEYPLLYHSSRASFSEKKTWPCIVKLAYKSPDPSKVKEHLYLVGKGVTYDTGGISLKIGGAMRGMSRDKLGACGLAGFVLATALVEEPGIDITCILAFERNSIGPNALLPDEVIVSRAGVRVLIGDTDAEGRLVMTDPVCECREKILAARAAGDNTPSAIYTAATLTGHVIRAYGWYGAAVANGPARKERWDHRLVVAGLAYGDPFENSVMRRDDHQFIESKTDREDVYQSNCNPSTQTDRGHQYPAAFIIKASGLDKHSLSAGKDAISFIHVDIAGSAEDGVEPGLGLMGITASPVATFAGAFWTA